MVNLLATDPPRWIEAAEVLRFLAVALIGFAIVARTTRFLNSDVLAGGIRAWAIERWGEDSHRAYLLSCPWCASIWLGAPVAVYGTLVLLDLPWQWDLFVIAGLWLGWSYAYGRLATWLDD